MLRRPLEILDRGRCLACPEAELAGETESARQPGFVAELLEYARRRSASSARDLLMLVTASREELEVRQRDGASAATPAVACGACRSDGLRQHRLRAIPLPGLEQRPPEQRQHASRRASSAGRSATARVEQTGRRPHIASGDRLRPRRRQPLGCTPRELQRSVARRPELDAVAIGPFEVVADDLVQLDEIGSALGDPDGEALVQLRPGRFRQRVVGCVADQQVAEAKGVLARELRLVRAQQLSAARAP